MSDELDEIKREFIEEATQIIDDIENQIISLESSTEKEKVFIEIGRGAHNLKGTAKAIGWEHINLLMHEYENLILKIQEEQEGRDIQTEEIDQLLSVNDHVKSILDELSNNINAEIEIDSILQSIKEKNASSIQNNLSQSEEKANLGNPGLGKTKNVSTSAAKKEAEDSIRVKLSRLDELINYVGEVVILHSVLKDQSNQSGSSELKQTVHQIGKLMQDVQSKSMNLRMVPIKGLVQKLKRIVRDSSKELNKKVELRVQGEGTELDKTVFEKLQDPLVHLIRNSIDHGIESKETRKKLGKVEKGIINLRAKSVSGKLKIELQDDGGGLNLNKLKSLAIKKGLIHESDPITEQQAKNLIFHPGLSTKDQVSDISGRGIGMDVVRSNIQSLGGQIAVDSQPDQGSTFTIELPLSLAVIDGLVVHCDNNKFVIPLMHVHESVRVKEKDIKESKGLGKTLRIRGEHIPLYRLECLLEASLHKQKRKVTEGTAIIVRSGTAPFAVLVDHILGNEKIVVKRLGHELQSLNGISGSTILGDGKPSLILELSDLFTNLQGSVRPKSSYSPNNASA